MSSAVPARVELRRVRGPEACELFLHARPTEAAEAGAQAEAIYRAIGEVLEGASIVSETIFLRSVRSDLELVRAARGRVLAANAGATTEIEQPPVDERAHLEVSVQALMPVTSEAPLAIERVEARPACPCAECARTGGLRYRIGGETHFHAASLYGQGDDAYAQTHAMFDAAEALLEEAGLTFRDVARTWIHLLEMDRDYADLNRARREFFAARGIDPPPASTGIGGAPVPQEHDLSLAVHAVQAATDEPAPERSVISAPTLNEAMLYGSDFTRGIRMVEANKVALHISGTASIDEQGRTAHPEDFDAQVDRMLLNVAALLEGQGASFGDVVSAITYLKRPSDAARLRAKLHEAGFDGFPNALVVARVCRPELLCETEALAVLPA